MRAPGLLGCVTIEDCEKLACQSAQLSATLSCDLHLALVGLHLFMSVVDSCAFLNPNRELWSRKGCHSRIRHVDPPPKKKKLLQQLKLTQQARAHDPRHRRQSQVRNCQQMRAPGLLEFVNVNEYNKPTCLTAKQLATRSTDSHLELVG